MMKNVTVHYSANADKTFLRSGTLENVQQCLEDIGFDFSKYNKLEAYRHEHKDQVTTIELEEM